MSREGGTAEAGSRSQGRCAMKTLIANRNYLAAAFAAGALAAAGSAPALAQSRDHTGSMMPFYYDGSGEQKTGAWQPEQNAQPQPRSSPHGGSTWRCGRARMTARSKQT